MTVIFLARDRAAGPADPPPLPAEVEARWWQPAVDGWPPPGLRDPASLAWWALARGGAFARPDFAMLSLWQDGTPAHRLIVTPRWWRFPFMAPGDLQLGALWTDPARRRRGLAALGLGLAIARFGPIAPRLWYVAEAANRGSIALAERHGFRRVGEGRRTAPAGLRLAGRYRIERPAG